MRSRKVETLLAQASKLTPSQKRQLLSVLGETDEAARVVEMLECYPHTKKVHRQECCALGARKGLKVLGIRSRWSWTSRCTTRSLSNWITSACWCAAMVHQTV